MTNAFTCQHINVSVNESATCISFFLRQMIAFCFALYHLTRVPLLDRSSACGASNTEGFHFSPKEYSVSQCSKGRFLGDKFYSGNRTDKKSNEWNSLGVLQSGMLNHMILFQACVSLGFTLSRYQVKGLCFFFLYFLLFFFPQQKPRKATPQPGEDTLNGHLPPGWQSYMSPQGRRYYVNTFTNGKWKLQ